MASLTSCREFIRVLTEAPEDIEVRTPVQDLELNYHELMLYQIKEQIILDIKNGNCKPKEAVRRYDNSARMLSQPICDDFKKGRFKYWRAKYNQRKRYEKQLFIAYNEAIATGQRARDAAEVANLSGDFVSVAPPESQRHMLPNPGVVPRVPGYTPSYTGGETKEPPMAEECISIPMADIDFGMPLLIIEGNEQREYANDDTIVNVSVTEHFGDPPAENQPPVRRRGRLLSPVTQPDWLND